MDCDDGGGGGKTGKKEFFPSSQWNSVYWIFFSSFPRGGRADLLRHGIDIEIVGGDLGSPFIPHCNLVPLFFFFSSRRMTEKETRKRGGGDSLSAFSALPLFPLFSFSFPPPPPPPPAALSRDASPLLLSRFERAVKVGFSALGCGVGLPHVLWITSIFPFSPSSAHYYPRRDSSALKALARGSWAELGGNKMTKKSRKPELTITSRLGSFFCKVSLDIVHLERTLSAPLSRPMSQRLMFSAYCKVFVAAFLPLHNFLLLVLG